MAGVEIMVCMYVHLANASFVVIPTMRNDWFIGAFLFPTDPLGVS